MVGSLLLLLPQQHIPGDWWWCALSLPTHFVGRTFILGSTWYTKKGPFSCCITFFSKKCITWRLGRTSRSRSILTTPTYPLLTAMCSAVCLLLFRALRSARCLESNSMTAGSSPKAAWCTARSPSLSSISSSPVARSKTRITWGNVELSKAAAFLAYIYFYY